MPSTRPEGEAFQLGSFATWPDTKGIQLKHFVFWPNNKVKYLRYLTGIVALPEVFQLFSWKAKPSGQVAKLLSSLLYTKTELKSMFFQYLNQTPWIFSQPWDSRPQSSSLDAPLSYPCLCLGTPFGAFKKRSVWGCTSKVSCYQSFSVSSEASMGFAYGTSKDLSTSAPNVLIDELSFKDDPNQITRTLSFGSSTMVSKNKGIQVTLRERFIQRLIVDGKKSIATKIFDESLELLKDHIQQYNLSTDSRGKSENLYSLATLTKDEIFIIALRKAQPWITTSSLRRGGKKVIIPEMLTAAQQESIAIRWLILNSRTTTGKSMAESLASELFGCLTNQGKTINQREQLHKLAEANRAWAN